MSSSTAEFLSKIDMMYNFVKSATDLELRDEDWLTNVLSSVGLYNDGRMHPENTNVHIYGEDVKYMNKIVNTGMWQIPRQLAQYLIKLSSFKNIETFLEVGTSSGCTSTVIAIYLMRFGLKMLQTVDITKYVNSSLEQKWLMLDLPIDYKIIPNDGDFTKHLPLHKYDVVFIDGNHDYKYVSADYNNAKRITSLITFHDINDCFCVDVVRLWNEIKASHLYKDIFEFTFHSHGYKLMGIGLLSL